MNTLLVGGAVAQLRTLPTASVHCCITSPPYWGLRDYGVEGQIGLEPTPELYVESIVAVFAEVRRVLRDDGTLWLNLGDSYTSSGRGGGVAASTINRSKKRHGGATPPGRSGGKATGARTHGRGAGVTEPTVASAHVAVRGLPPKNLVGIPWRVAFALQAAGWNLRMDIIWAKPNPMPESVQDRPTRAHEYLFLLSKSERYFYDADAIKEQASGRAHSRGTARINPKAQGIERRSGIKSNASMSDALRELVGQRNVRSVWTMGSEPYAEAHFATFPEALPKRCILAGTSERGACALCGAPYTRILERQERPVVRSVVAENERDGGLTAEHGMERTGMSHRAYAEWLAAHPAKTVGWQKPCDCPTEKTEPCVVLDPFAGAGTTLAVADAHQRTWWGIELNPEYAAMARRRVQKDGAPLFSGAAR